MAAERLGRGTAMKMRGRIDAFLFAPVNARVVDVFRVGLALIMAKVFWPGPLRMQTWIVDLPGLGEINLQPWWFPLVLLALTMFALGWRHRWMAFGLAILLWPALESSGFGKSRQVLYVAFLAVSLLRSEFCFGFFHRNGETRPRAYGPIWPIRLVQFQLSALYFVNAAAKMTPDYLSGHVLTEMSRHYSNFKVDLTSGFMPIGPLEIPVLLCAVGTVLVEFSLAFGFWFRRTRVATACLGVIFHVSLSFIVVIGWLDWASVFLYSSFLLPIEDRSSSSELPRRKRRRS